MATEMPSKENNQSRDDGYDIDYYEKEGNESNMRNLKEMLDDARRETHNVKMKLNSFAKYSMLGLIILIVLILVLLSLTVVTMTAGGKGGGGGGERATDGKESPMKITNNPISSDTSSDESGTRTRTLNTKKINPYRIRSTLTYMLINIKFDVLALLVTGGWNGLARRSAELVFKNGSSCELPDLPEPKWGHIQAGVFTCGGGSSSSSYPTSCYTLTGNYGRYSLVGLKVGGTSTFRSPQG